MISDLTEGERPSPSDASPPSRRDVHAIAVFALIITLFGIGARQYLVSRGLAEPLAPPPWNIFYRLYALHELPFLLLLLPFVAAWWWLASRRSDSVSVLDDVAPAGWLARLGATPTWIVAVSVFIAAAAGTKLVMHDMLLSMDEFAADFQARIFASGSVAAEIPARWQGLVGWMTPTFITWKSDQQLWVSSYLPVYSALRAAFKVLSADWLLNPALAGTSIALLGASAARLWPGDDQRRVLALVLLASSSQFLLMSMSGYAMPAHLCFNLLWLWLYLRDDRAGWALLPFAGVLAMGLHNPFPHALFVTPFLFRLLFRRRYALIAYLAVVYLAGAAMWLQWLRFSTSTSAAPAPGAGGGMISGLLASFRLPGATQRLVQGLDATLLFTWQTPVFGLLFLLAVASWRRLRVHERDLASGVLLTFAFYAFFPVDQGHGWGYRYVYGALGSMALLAATGVVQARALIAERPLRTLLAASFAATLLFQLPLRVVQAESFVRPWAVARDFIAMRPEPIVAVEFEHGWYTADLIRNDPLFEQGPRVIAFRRQWVNAIIPQIPPAYRDSVFVVSREHIEAFGLALAVPARR